MGIPDEIKTNVELELLESCHIYGSPIIQRVMCTSSVIHIHSIEHVFLSVEWHLTDVGTTFTLNLLTLY